MLVVVNQTKTFAANSKFSAENIANYPTLTRLLLQAKLKQLSEVYV